MKINNIMLNPYSGKFIAFEGIDFSGKTTASKSLTDELNKSEETTILTVEPFRNMDLKKRIDLTPLGRQELFIYDRHEHLVDLIIPTLDSGKNVITDRFMLSTIAYGMSESIEQKKLLDLHEEILGTDFIIPDITFIIDVPIDVAIERLKERQKETGETPHYFEKRDSLERIRDNYLLICANKFYKDQGFNIQLIDGNRSKKDVFSEILEKIIDILDK